MSQPEDVKTVRAGITGLTSCQARSKNKLDFHFNTALTTVNLAKHAHFNPNVTWWSRFEAFLSYINRSQVMLQHGLFMADVAWYYLFHYLGNAQ